MYYLYNPIKKYLDDLGAKLPAPGGGSVAALSAALGCGLLLMVANYTKGKDKYRRYEPDILKAIKTLTKLEKKNRALIDKDVAAYEALSSAFKSKDKRRIQSALKKALGVPLEISEGAAAALSIAQDLSKKGNVNLITDTAIGALLLEDAYYSGKLNVQINLKLIKDSGFKKKINKSIAVLEKSIKGKKTSVFKETRKFLKGG